MSGEIIPFPKEDADLYEDEDRIRGLLVEHFDGDIEEGGEEARGGFREIEEVCGDVAGFEGCLEGVRGCGR